MTKIVIALKSYKAEYAAGADKDAAVIFDFDPPLANRFVEVDGMAGVSTALAIYLDDLKALGEPAAASVGLLRGQRSPNGFKKLYDSFFIVNIKKPE